MVGAATALTTGAVVVQGAVAAVNGLGSAGSGPPAGFIEAAPLATVDMCAVGARSVGGGPSTGTCATAGAHNPASTVLMNFAYGNSASDVHPQFCPNVANICLTRASASGVLSASKFRATAASTMVVHEACAGAAGAAQAAVAASRAVTASLNDATAFFRASSPAIAFACAASSRLRKVIHFFSMPSRCASAAISCAERSLRYSIGV